MKITSICLKHTNPSMGPHERIITYSMSNHTLHENEFEQLLQASTVNQDYSLIDFIKAHQEENHTLLEKINAIHADQTLPSGGTISKLSIELDAGLSVEISDLRVLHLGGYYQQFIPYLVEHGHRSEYSGWEATPPLPLIVEKEILPEPSSSLDDEGNHLTDR